MPPLTSDDMNRIKALAKAGRIKEARALLESFEGERARAALVKLNERYPEDVKIKEIPKRSDRRLWAAVICLGLAIAAAGLPALQNYINRIPTRLAVVCYVEASDRYYQDDLAMDNLPKACDATVRSAMSTHGDEIQYCFNARGDTNRRFTECLNEERVNLNPGSELQKLIENARK